MLPSTLKSTLGSVSTGPEPNGFQQRSTAPSLTMLKLNKTLLPPLQLTGNGKELSRRATTATAVSRRELIGLAATTLGGLALFAAESAEAVEVADIGSSINELFGFFKGKPKTGADSEKKPKSDSDVKKPKAEENGKKPKSEGDEKKPKVEGHGDKPKIEVDDKKALTPHHPEKDKVLASSAVAPTLPNILNNSVP